MPTSSKKVPTLVAGLLPIKFIPPTMARTASVIPASARGAVSGIAELDASSSLQAAQAVAGDVMIVRWNGSWPATRPAVSVVWAEAPSSISSPATWTANAPSWLLDNDRFEIADYASPPPVLLFEDTFDGALGSAPNPAKWNYERDGGTYADSFAGTFTGRNNELQYYTNDDRDNAQLDGAGALDIVLRTEAIGGKAYSSAMLHTNGKFTFLTGYIEASIATPVGDGVWPAFWTEGVNAGTSWPSHGEVDMMEQVNSDNYHNTNVHGGPTHWSAYHGQSFTRNATVYHVYGALITESKVEFYLDNVLIDTVLASETPPGQGWPFGTYPQFIRLNLAMGGDFPNANGGLHPDGSATLPAHMKVKTVRVWDRKPITPLT